MTGHRRVGMCACVCMCVYMWMYVDASDFKIADHKVRWICANRQQVRACVYVCIHVYICVCVRV